MPSSQFGCPLAARGVPAEASQVQRLLGAACSEERPARDCGRSRGFSVRVPAHVPHSRRPSSLDRNRMRRKLLDASEDFTCLGYDESQVQDAAGGLIALCFAFVFLILARARCQAAFGRRDSAHVLVLPIYTTFLIVLCIVLVARAALFWFVPTDSHRFYALELGPLNGVVAALRDGIAVFLVQDSAGVDAVRLTGLFMLCWAVLQGLLGLNYVSGGFDAHNYWTVHDVTIVVFHLLIVVVALVKHQRRRARSAGTAADGDAQSGPGRRAVWLYSPYMMLGFGLYLSTMLSAWPADMIGCVWAGTDLGNYLLWPLIVWASLRCDSLYWCNIGVVLDPARDKRGDGSFEPLLRSAMPTTSTMLDFSRLSLGSVLGRGGSASVLMGTLDGSKRVAVKKFVCKSLLEADAKSYLREVSVLEGLRHTNIVRLYGVVVAPPSLLLVMECMGRGSLFDVLSRAKAAQQGAALLPADEELTGGRRLSMARDLFRALAFLHEQTPPVLHGDVKSLNALLDDNWRLCLADFGESRFSDNYSKIHHRRLLQHQAGGATAVDIDHGGGRSKSAAVERRPPPGLRVEERRALTRHGAGAAAAPARIDERGAAAGPSAAAPAAAESKAAGGPTSRSGFHSFHFASQDATVTRDLLTAHHTGSSGSHSSRYSSADMLRHPGGVIGPSAADDPGFRQTPQWCAPEVMRGEPYTAASDVYSGGLVLWEIWAGMPPYHNILPQDVPGLVIAGARPPIPPSIPADVARVIQMCWSHSPRSRPTAHAVLDALAPTPRASPR